MTTTNTEASYLPVERHPWPPFIPPRARVLIMGTFPPKPVRWSMDFYYPNRTNEFWRVMGLVFFGNADRFYDPVTRSFRLDDIRRLLTERGIALNDTGAAVRRLRDNASDKYLEIVEPVRLHELLALMPTCRTVATTGAKAAEVVASLTSTPVPAQGAMVTAADGLEIWRMPSTSRAYPLPLAEKAARYERMFRHIGLV